MEASAQPKLSSVSFFCPAYNDEQNLPVLIPRVSEFLKKITDTYEIIIVHDGGNDQTGSVADKMAEQCQYVRVIHHPQNMGYGATLRDGYHASKYDYIMYTDGDNQYDISEFLPYLHLLGDADVLSGYVTTKAVSFGRKVQSFIYNVLIHVLFFVHVRDINCAMKMFKRTVLNTIDIKSTSAFIDAETIIKARRAGFQVAQFPVTHFPRTAGVASGSKPSVILATIRDMILYRFGIL